MQRYEGLLTGAAQFAADLSENAAWIAFVRSPIAHGAIVNIDVTKAARRDGVFGVFTAADLDLVPIWEIHMIPDRFAQPPLADGVVRYVGEKVVAVVAQTLAAAIDASEAVVIEYEQHPPLADVRAALVDGAPVLFPEHGSNVALRWEADSSSYVPDASDVTVSGVMRMPRLAVAPLEGLAALVVPNGEHLTMYVSTQSPYATRVQTARSLRLPLDDIRVVTPRVGGAFGGKSLGGIAEYVVTAAVAKRLQRPVRFVEDRNSNLIGMQGRGLELSFTLHADSAGRVQHLDVEELCDAGAYAQTNSVEPGKTMMMLCGPYRLPSVRFRGLSVLTTRCPVGAYRGPGRSESTAVLERAMDLLAAKVGIDPVDVRRRNLLTPGELPTVSAGGAHYDDGDYPAVLDTLVERARYATLRDEQRQRRASNSRVLLGVGVASVLDSSAWFARSDDAWVGVTERGTVRVVAGTASAGQEHAAAFAAIVARVLPVSPGDVEVVEGDTALAGGSGSSGSRTAQVVGSAVHLAATQVLDRARQLAADRLEAAVEDIVCADGGFGVRGVPARLVPLAELAEKGDLDARCSYDQPNPTYPAGAHLAAVEVDRETGEVRVRQHVAITDCGFVVDHPGAHGQVVGASAQGVAQVLFEEATYDGDANPLTSNLAEYLLPSAAEQPPFDATFISSPSAVNPLGARGVGEIGMVGAPAAVWNAVIDALSHLGVEHIDLPCTPERVWRALRATVR